MKNIDHFLWYFDNNMWLYFITEIPAKFTIPLKEKECIEGQSVTLTCSMDKPDQKVTWYKNGQEIVPDDNVKVTICALFFSVHTLM